MKSKPIPKIKRRCEHSLVLDTIDNLNKEDRLIAYHCEKCNKVTGEIESRKDKPKANPLVDRDIQFVENNKNHVVEMPKWKDLIKPIRLKCGHLSEWTLSLNDEEKNASEDKSVGWWIDKNGKFITHDLCECGNKMLRFYYDKPKYILNSATAKRIDYIDETGKEKFKFICIKCYRKKENMKNGTN